MADPAFDQPQVLAVRCLDLPRPWLVGVDIDGTLAPIVATPELSRLAPNALATLARLSDAVGVMIAIVSGRPLRDLRNRFELPSNLLLLGSHGAEVGSEVDERTDREQHLITAATAKLSELAADLPGAWIEHKPLAVALHVRQVEDVAGEVSLDALRAELSGLPELTLHRGHKVLEVAVRPASKAIAFEQLQRRLEPATTFFIGDDQSDEHVFQSLGPRNVTVKVGGGSTSADHRLASPTEVVQFLAILADSLATAQPISTAEQ